MLPRNKRSSDTIAGNRHCRRTSGMERLWLTHICKKQAVSWLYFTTQPIPAQVAAVAGIPPPPPPPSLTWHILLEYKSLLVETLNIAPNPHKMSTTSQVGTPAVA